MSDVAGVRPTHPPATRTRLLISFAVGIAAAALVVFGGLRFPEFKSDFDQVWFAARALLEGRDPYPLIGLGREFDSAFELYYPLTAPIIVAPLGYLPVLAARAAFVFVSCGLLAFLVTREGYFRLPLFLSGSFVTCLQLVQWTPLIACGMLVPALGFVAASKPNVGIAAVGAARRWKDFLLAAGGVILVTGIAFTILPTWFAEWRSALSTATHFRAYIEMPAGQLLALTVLRWRRWDARLLALLSVVPQTPGANAALLFFLFPQTRVQVMALALLTFVPVFVGVKAAYTPTVEEYSAIMGYVTLYSVYLPVLWWVLRQPNVGPVPTWLERVVHPLPAWIRGRGEAPAAVSS